MLTDGRVLVAVEIEASQTHPDTNVGKYWLLHAEHQRYEKIVLFHIYTPDFESYPGRKRLGEFYAEKMRGEVPLDYKMLDYRSATDYDLVLKEVCRTVGDRVAQEFGSTATHG